MNPGNAPLDVGQLLDDECPEDFIKGLILSVRSLLPVEPLVEECEKRCASFFHPASPNYHIIFSHFTFYAQKSSSLAYSVFGASCK